MDYPRTRRLEPSPLTHQGREMIALRDPEGYFEDVVVITPPAYFVAALCDGSRSLRDIQTAYVRKFGDIITTDQLSAVLEKLDEQLILDGPRFRRLKEGRDREYMSLPNRPMILAGRSYAPQPRELASRIAAMLEAAEGNEADPGLPLGLVAPHIDPERGGHCYGETYAYLARSIPEGVRPLVVILGTCHGEMEGRFALTAKNYLSPFGLVETDAAVAAQVARAAGMDGLGDELSHRHEHSIEMQLPFLSVVFGGSENFRILPVTCNSFHPFIEGKASPAADAEVAGFIRALQGLNSALGEEVMFLAAADLAHVGRRFGGLLPVDTVILSSVALKDKAMLAAAEEGDAEGFYDYIMREEDSRHVCGLSPIYTMVAALAGTNGRLLQYDQWFDLREGSAVTFAGMTFPRRRAKRA
jgi:AmmeMemoRadiSam system protein B